MAKLLLLSPALDAAGAYRDTGSTLSIEDSGEPETVSPVRAGELIDGGLASPVPMAERDPLDHDGDGRKGGSLPRKA